MPITTVKPEWALRILDTLAMPDVLPWEKKQMCKKTLYLSETQLSQDPAYKFRAPYVLFHKQRGNKQWFFNDMRVVQKEALRLGYKIA